MNKKNLGGICGTADLNQLVQEAAKTGALFYYAYSPQEDYTFISKEGFREGRGIWSRHWPESAEHGCEVVWRLSTQMSKHYPSHIVGINEALILRQLDEQLSDIAENGTEEPAFEIVYQGDAGKDPWGRPSNRKHIGLVTSMQKVRDIAVTSAEHPKQVNEAFENLFPALPYKAKVRRNGRIVMATRDEIGMIAPELLTRKRPRAIKELLGPYIQALEQAGMVRTYQVPSE